jgi:hypothetical protein
LREAAFRAEAKSVTGSVGEDVDSVSARCDRGRQVVSGGFEIPGGLGPLITTSRRTGKREWTVETFSEGGVVRAHRYRVLRPAREGPEGEIDH